MDGPWINNCIPAGCLEIPFDTPDLPPEIWTLVELQDWLFFARTQDQSIPESSPLGPKLRLGPKFQQALLRTPVLLPFQRLWKKKWIELSFRHIGGPAGVIGRIRVYLLPHDTTSSRVSGSEHDKLTKSIQRLLPLLDYSSESWSGQYDTTRQGQPTMFGTNALPAVDGAETSLLDMFNNVPSPTPDPSMVSDPAIREAMRSIMDNHVPGLQSVLYFYQRDSVALMLQREMEPGRLVDPRLRPSVDQSGKPWYYDTVSGIVLKNPNYYDAPRGGILAEEMGTGKTLICLALILATRHQPTTAPEPFVAETPRRSREASLMDIAAAAANKHSISWRPYFEACHAQFGLQYRNCIDALERPENRAIYTIRDETLLEPRRSVRHAGTIAESKAVYLSSCTLIIVPNNLVTQWRNEIKKHTTDLKVLVITDNRTQIPQVTILLTYDIIIFSHTRFEHIQKERQAPVTNLYMKAYCPLEHIRFKRCIIDEGHKLGSNGPGFRSDLMRVVDRLEIAARWVVTGTPSRGLYGVDQELAETGHSRGERNYDTEQKSDAAIQQEREDLQRIGNLATKYLKVRPWANTRDEPGDTVADWNVYVMNKKQHIKGHNRRDCLKGTLDSLIIRHSLADVSQMLPQVNEKIVVLDGSFQDKLALNLFSMVIIFNSVQSQRTDMDYFFHRRQRKSLIQLVNNLRQASFFGGVFFSAGDIKKAIQTAEEFLEKKEVPISTEDEKLLKQAIDFGKLAAGNRLKDVSNQFHALPIYLEHFPGGNGKGWSLDDRGEGDEPVCTDASLVLALQKYLNPCIDAPTSLQLMIDSGRLDSQGKAERSQALTAAAEAAGSSTGQNSQAGALAGNTPLGDDHHAKPKSGSLANPISLASTDDQNSSSAGLDATTVSKIEIAEPLAKTRIISTASAKLSYLIDQIVKYQDEEQIIVFYDNNNIAYYLAGVLETLQVQHLIYTRAGLKAERRSQYIATFNEPDSRFRVMLMDISQAAFGLDMRNASRVYFISPVLNPQVEAQAVGRARRISQQRPVVVETLVLRGSIEELIVNRRHNMSPAEHRLVSGLLDDRPLYEWILNARILPMDDEHGGDDFQVENGEAVNDGLAQTARLETPQFVFGRGFGRQMHPDEGLLMPDSPETKAHTKQRGLSSDSVGKFSRETSNVGDPTRDAVATSKPAGKGALKRQRSPAAAAMSSPSTRDDADGSSRLASGANSTAAVPSKKRRVRIAWVDEEDGS